MGGCEGHMRDIANELRTDNLTSELAMFTFPIGGGEELRAEPMIYVPNIIAKILSLLNEHERYV